MAAKKTFHKNKSHTQAHLYRKHILIRERNYIQQHYDFLNCSLDNKKLLCKGKTQPTEFSPEYKFEIYYDGRASPSVYVRDPTIEYHDDIHMFPKDNALCLYHPESDDFLWEPTKHHIHNTIIPWTQEWFIFYELYSITGKWEHPFHPHLNNKGQ